MGISELIFFFPFYIRVIKVVCLKKHFRAALLIFFVSDSKEVIMSRNCRSYRIKICPTDAIFQVSPTIICGAEEDISIRVEKTSLVNYRYFLVNNSNKMKRITAEIDTNKSYTPLPWRKVMEPGEIISLFKISTVNIANIKKIFIIDHFNMETSEEKLFST